MTVLDDLRCAVGALREQGHRVVGVTVRPCAMRVFDEAVGGGRILWSVLEWDGLQVLAVENQQEAVLIRTGSDA